MARLYYVLSLIFLSGIAAGQIDDPNGTPAVDPAPATPEPTPISPYYDSVWVKVLPNIITECKTCPYSLCPNKDFYGSTYMFRASCWASGQKINSTK
jgi:hypothetical protein